MLKRGVKAVNIPFPVFGSRVKLATAFFGVVAIAEKQKRRIFLNKPLINIAISLNRSFYKKSKYSQ